MSERSKWEREKGIFASFIEAMPLFAGEPIVDWKHNGNDPPGIICVDRLGSTIGVEMTEWMNEQQTRDFSGWEKVLKPVVVPNGWAVSVSMNPFGQDCAPPERPEIAQELSKVIGEEISRPKVRKSGLLSFAISGAGLKGRAPTAAKYCNVVAGNNFASGRPRLLPAGSFSPCDAAAALRAVISKKVRRESYAAIKQELKLRSLCLLVYYDLAIVKNTPNVDVDVVATAASAMSSVQHPFDLAYVLMFPGADTTGRTVYRIPVEKQPGPSMG